MAHGFEFPELDESQKRIIRSLSKKRAKKKILGWFPHFESNEVNRLLLEARN